MKSGTDLLLEDLVEVLENLSGLLPVGPNRRGGGQLRLSF